jgi:hypothetical protein
VAVKYIRGDQVKHGTTAERCQALVIEAFTHLQVSMVCFSDQPR